MGFVTLNVDLTWKLEPPSTGLSVVLRNYGHILLVVVVRSMDLHFEAPLAEVVAIVEGIHFVVSLSYPNLIVVSDCLHAIKRISRSDTCFSANDCWIE